LAADSAVVLAAPAGDLRVGSEAGCALTGAAVETLALAGASTFVLFASFDFASGAGDETSALTGLRAVVVFRAAVLGVALVGI